MQKPAKTPARMPSSHKNSQPSVHRPHCKYCNCPTSTMYPHQQQHQPQDQPAKTRRPRSKSTPANRKVRASARSGVAPVPYDSSRSSLHAPLLTHALLRQAKQDENNNGNALHTNHSVTVYPRSSTQKHKKQQKGRQGHEDRDAQLGKTICRGRGRARVRKSTTTWQSSDVSKRTTVASCPAPLYSSRRLHSVDSGVRHCVLDHDSDGMRLASACVCIPHPLKAHKRGEDAFCLSGHAVGVFDGVGSWERYDIDAGLYSKALSRAVARQVRSPCTASAKTALTAGVRRVHASGIKGSTTALLCVLSRDGVLEVCNVGDSMAVVVRDFHTVVYASSAQHHAFNTPFQVGHTSIEDMGRAAVERVPVQPLDVVIAGSDGLWDNIYTSTLVDTVRRHATANKIRRRYGYGDVKKFVDGLALDIAKQACAMANQTVTPSPFAQSARRHGYKDMGGGKLDDITAVVSLVMASGVQRQSFRYTSC